MPDAPIFSPDDSVARHRRLLRPAAGQKPGPRQRRIGGATNGLRAGVRRRRTGRSCCGGGVGRAAAGGPNVGPTAAPGVAFNYHYAFRLAAPRIAQVQEEHAQMCERLTIARCRITGLLYRYIDERNIEARLELKLDPAIARVFGRSGIEAVTRAEGMLTLSEISGVDVGTAIRAASRSIAEMTADLARIEAQLRQPGLGGDQKAELEYQAQQLRDSIRAARDNREQQQETLATTPMVFEYGSGDLVPGFEQRPTIRQAADRAIDNFLQAGTILLIILVTILPFALAGGLIWWLIVLARRRWYRRPETPAVTATG
jgi:hypothetical protein